MTYADGVRTDEIRGNQLFYLAAAQVSVDGTGLGVWRIRAWEDLGSELPATAGTRRVADSRSISIGLLKDWYRY